MPCPCTNTPPPATAGVDTGREIRMSKDRVVTLLIGIAVGYVVVPKLRAKLGV